MSTAFRDMANGPSVLAQPLQVASATSFASVLPYQQQAASGPCDQFVLGEESTERKPPINNIQRQPIIVRRPPLPLLSTIACDEQLALSDDGGPDESTAVFAEEPHLVEQIVARQSGHNSDTDEASESECPKPAITMDIEMGLIRLKREEEEDNEPVEIKEQMYQDKLASLKRLLDELKDGSHPDYVRRVKKLEAQFRERLRANEVYRDYLLECVERDYANEKRAATKEYDERRVDLKENLISDFEDKRKQIESERHSMELAGDTTDLKPTVTRKLRRRPNEPVPVAAEKRRKPATGTLVVLLLEDKDIDNDLKQITRGKLCGVPGPLGSSPGASNAGSSMHRNGIGLPHVGMAGGMHLSSVTAASIMAEMSVETRIEDGKLLYERRWYHRGQPVFVEGKELSKFAGTISAISNDAIWVKKVIDNCKVKINTFQLSRGKIAIKRRAN